MNKLVSVYEEEQVFTLRYSHSLITEDEWMDLGDKLTPSMQGSIDFSRLETLLLLSAATLVC